MSPLAGFLLTPDFDELVIEVVAFAGALADAGEHRVAAVGLGDVVDELLNEHGLADASAAEQADLAALGVGREQVDDLDAGDEDLRFRRLVDEGRRGLMDGAALGGLDGACLVDGIADDVHDAAERLLADRHRDRIAGVLHGLAAHEAFRRVHGDGAHGVLAQMLGHLEHEARTAVIGLERVENGRQAALELHVDDRAHDLSDFADPSVRHDTSSWSIRLFGYSASAPEMISISSLVICA